MPATATPPLVLVFPTRLPALRLSEVSTAEPTSWIQVAVVGDYEDARYGPFSITRAHLAAMALNFTEGKFPEPPTEICVDYDHLTTKEAKAPGDGKAAGWFKALETRANGDELWAEVEWTEAGATAIDTKEYRFFSPYFTTAYKTGTGEDIGPTLLNGAITNRPFLQGMQPLSLALSAPGLDTRRGVFSLATLTDNDKRARLQAALCDAFGESCSYELWLVDTVGGVDAIYCFRGTYYVVGFTVADDGTVTFTSDPEEVVIQYARLNGGMGGTSLMATFTLKAADGKTVTIDDKALEDTPLVKALRARLPADGQKVVAAAEFDALDTSVKTLSQQVQTLTTSLEAEKTEGETLRKALAQQAAEAKVDALIKAGKVVPAQRETYVELAQANAEMFGKLTETMPVVVKLDAAIGSGEDSGGPGQQLAAAAKALRTADPTLTEEQATARALEQNPALYEA